MSQLTINAVYEAEKHDTFRLYDTSQLIVDRSKRGRVDQNDELAIESMADSIEVFGQQQPVLCSRNSAGTLTLLSGFTRFDAIELLNKTRTKLDKIPLWVSVISEKVLDAKQAFLRTVIENVHRRQTTPLDDATNQEVLRTVHGMSSAEIGKHYRMSDSRVRQLSRLLNLIEPIKNLVAKGKLSSTAAEELGGLDEAGQQEWLDEVWLKTGDVDLKVTTADVKATVDKVRKEAGESGRTMTMAALKKWLQSAVTAEDCPDLFRDFCVSFGRFISGDADEIHVWHCVDAMMGVEKQTRRKAG